MKQLTGIGMMTLHVCPDIIYWKFSMSVLSSEVLYEHLFSYWLCFFALFRLTALKSANHTVKTTWRGQSSDREKNNSLTVKGGYYIMMINIAVLFCCIINCSKRVFSCTYRLALEDEMTIMNIRIQKYGESRLWKD